MVTESAVSMLPAVVSGSKYIADFVPDEAPVQPLVAPVAPVADAAAADMLNETAPQTDEVLSQWDEQTWWDAAVPTQTVPDVIATPDRQSASIGLLGAILALAPRSLRRRRKDESAI